MIPNALHGVLTATRPDDPRSPDAELLRRFAEDGDAQAFRSLIDRYGSMVLSACRRIVREEHLAEDAFQAVFLVLATRAARLDRARSLGPWLYGVTMNVARRARDQASRRRRREALVDELPDQSSVPPANDVADIIDEEIAQLSPVCREALILCELQGLSRAQAAERLRAPEGTISSRLAAAKKSLAERLRRRGVTGPIVLVGASVSLSLVERAVRASQGGAPIAIARLAQSAVRTMLLSKLKLAVPLLLVSVVAVAVIITITREPVSAAPAPKAGVDGGTIWLYSYKSGKLTGYSASGEITRTLSLRDGRNLRGMTPDGKLAFVGRNGELYHEGDDSSLTIHLRSINDSIRGTDTGVPFSRDRRDQHYWSPDMKQVVIAQQIIRPRQIEPEFRHTLVDVAAGKRSTIDVSGEPIHVVGWSGDGRWLLAVKYSVDRKVGDTTSFRTVYHRLEWQSGKLQPIVDSHQLYNGVVSPDGRYLVACGRKLSDEIDAAIVIYVHDLHRDSIREIARHDSKELAQFRWSPDGKRIAYLLRPTGDSPTSSMHFCDIDGGRTRKFDVTLEKASDPFPELSLLGWLAEVPSTGGAEKWATVRGQIIWDDKAGPRPKQTRIPPQRGESVSSQDKEFLTENWVVDPKSGGIKNVIVWLAPEPSAQQLDELQKKGSVRFPSFSPTDIHPDLRKVNKPTVELDQPFIRFEPHVVLAREGQKLTIKNSMPLQNNARIDSSNNNFYNAMIMPGESFTTPDPLVAERAPIRVTSSIYPCMTAWVRVFDHPYFALTDADGRFEIRQVPVMEGKLRLFLWQESTGYHGRTKGRLGASIAVKPGVVDLGAWKFDLGASDDRR